MGKERNQAFDILRIIACFSVVMLHVSSRYIMSIGVETLDFRSSNAYNSLSQVGVPIFVMISGALFLDSNYKTSIKKIWLHNILRIVICFFIWGFAYYVYQSVYLWHFDFYRQGILRTITGIAYASDHLWYLGMIVGLYALVPVLRSYLEKTDKKNIQYLLYLVGIFQIAKTTIVILLDSSLVNRFVELFGIVELTGYLGYFIWGYYIVHFGITKNIRTLLYVLVPLALVVNYVVSMHMSLKAGAYNPGIYSGFCIFTFIEVSALFVAVKEICNKVKINKTVGKVLKSVSADSFGVYLLHMMIIDYLYEEGFFGKLSPNLVWQIPLSLAVFIVSMLVATVLRRIPFVGRYIC